LPSELGSALRSALDIGAFTIICQHGDSQLMQINSALPLEADD